MREGNHSITGSMIQMPLTSRYNSKKLDGMSRPQFNNSQKGKLF
jgi:hypothetical protein